VIDTMLFTPQEAEALPPGQWVIDVNGEALCLVDTRVGWQQPMFMHPGGAAFTALDHVDYPLRLADPAPGWTCAHAWGATECGHCRCCGTVLAGCGGAW